MSLELQLSTILNAVERDTHGVTKTASATSASSTLSVDSQQGIHVFSAELSFGSDGPIFDLTALPVPGGTLTLTNVRGLVVIVEQGKVVFDREHETLDIWAHTPRTAMSSLTVEGPGVFAIGTADSDLGVSSASRILHLEQVFSGEGAGSGFGDDLPVVGKIIIYGEGTIA
jgi:hypothetical protein